jgi:GTP-binding protein Era
MITIAGRPNSGKSTLLNALVGEKLAITAPQAQTTRTSFQGVLTTPDWQAIFVDTPGIHKSDSLFNKRMMDTVRTALENRDLILFVADVTTEISEAEEHATSALPQAAKVLLVLNKIDRVKDKRRLLPLIQKYGQLFAFEEMIPVSARTGEGLEELKRAIAKRLPQSPALFPEDHLTDQPVRFMTAEMIREHILRAAREEVPHAAAVLIDSWQQVANLTRIAATIYVERPGQKAILVGTKANVLKTIGIRARQDIERLLGHKVYLALFVKVKPKWREDPEFLNAIDWRSMAGNEVGH